MNKWGTKLEFGIVLVFGSLLGIIGFGYLYALKYKHLWKDAENLFRSMSIRELFKDLKKKKKEK